MINLQGANNKDLRRRHSIDTIMNQWSVIKRVLSVSNVVWSRRPALFGRTSCGSRWLRRPAWCIGSMAEMGWCMHEINIPLQVILSHHWRLLSHQAVRWLQELMSLLSARHWSPDQNSYQALTAHQSFDCYTVVSWLPGAVYRFPEEKPKRL